MTSIPVWEAACRNSQIRSEGRRSPSKPNPAQRWVLPFLEILVVLGALWLILVLAWAASTI